MLGITYANGVSERNLLAELQKRGEEVSNRVTTAVENILYEVRQRGDDAVNEFTERFDGRLPIHTEVSQAEMDDALQSRDTSFTYALYKAAENIKKYHEGQVQQSRIITNSDSTILGQRIRGLNRVGVYVPGGTAAYPSSVLMNTIPAKIAGVNEVIMVTPPMKNGTANPDILAAAKIAGVDRVFLMGGAQAIGALAYGTRTVPKVDKIVGPGNIYVATAKKLLFGTVDIDMIAGPSEILIIADETANPKYIAADLMSQAEHDRQASAVLLTTSKKIAEETITELYKQMKALSRKEIIEEALNNFGAVILFDEMGKAVDFANEVAPEHLEVCAANPLEFVGKIDNAGSVFLGNYSPEPLGDYYAGPNHVLPTGGTARFFSPLSVDSFVKKSSFIYYTQSALQNASFDIIKLAETEGLTAHANSIKVRM